MPKLPDYEGLKRYRKWFKKSITRQPSDELVRIVEESLRNGEEARKEKAKDIKKIAQPPGEVNK